MRSFQDLERDRRAMAVARRQFESAREEAASPALRVGDQAVANADSIGKLKRSSIMQDAEQAGRLGAGGASAATQPEDGYRVTRNYAQQVKRVAGRAFYQNQNRWTDSAAQGRADLKQQTIQFGSDDYFALLRDHPTAAQWLALGNNVDFVIGDTMYSVRDEG
jgi:hypothetical protein